ncbi:LamG domain-containing protein [Pyxidicoccus sp. 3LFB2]
MTLKRTLFVVGMLVGCGPAKTEEPGPVSREGLEVTGESQAGLGVYEVEPRAYKLGHRGGLDTGVLLGSFVGQPFTLTAWVMPEYTHNDHGPFFTERSGTGNMFFFGQGDYWNGDVDRTDKIPGMPVLLVSIAGKSVSYLAPNYTLRRWNHVALVRGADSRLRAYVDGAELIPFSRSGTASNIPLGAGDVLPNGTLSFGSRNESQPVDDYDRFTQFYGLIDDVAVYTRALSQSELTAMATSGSTFSNTQGLLAGWTFDRYGTGVSVPPPLNPALNPRGRLHHLVVSGTRASSDASRLEAAAYISPSSGSFTLPFARGESWRVVQAPDHPTGSHNGDDAFCWDLVQVDAPDGIFNSTGTAGVMLRAATEGVVSVVQESHNPVPGGSQETNAVMQQATSVATGWPVPDEFIVYRHLQFLSAVPEVGDGLSVGDAVGRVGYNARHLHIGMRQDPDVGFTVPMAFSNYEVWDWPTLQWRAVSRGMPKEDDIVRRRCDFWVPDVTGVRCGTP